MSMIDHIQSNSSFRTKSLSSGPLASAQGHQLDVFIQWLLNCVGGCLDPGNRGLAAGFLGGTLRVLRGRESPHEWRV